ncbi:AN1-type zinc finger protein 6 isoform X2 [Xyrauchen texanus]|uniref:AN1-type zinc finger protein 6 isoform X2 n=1 Tax=Xyrauchen texanus TaxID=154827 RepID=UPI002241BECA|nr:AN1-type zinc finger protein 6 isoform X2 [Xyrauchen texanus]
MVQVNKKKSTEDKTLNNAIPVCKVLNIRSQQEEMAQETNQTQVLCANGCGFYGNPRNNGMCSVCYKDSLQRQNNSGRSSDPVSSSKSNIGETMTVQSTSQHEQHSILSSQILSTPAAAAHKDEASGVAQAALKTQEKPDEVSSSKLTRNIQEKASTDQLLTAGISVEYSISRGKRKLEETSLQVDFQLSESDAVSEQASDVPEQSKPKKNRCFTCRKKVGLTGFDCRCGNIFCTAHRYSDTHNCSFDYKADAAEKIRKENPLIIGEKVKKI